MGLWFNGKRQSGWFALGLFADHVDLIHVKRAASGRPEVVLCETYAREGSETETLSRLRKEFKLDRCRCTTLVRSDDYQMRQIDAPNVPANELKSAVSWKLKDMIEYPIEAATIDFLDIPGDPSAPTRNHQLFVVSVSNEVIARCVQPFNDAQVSLEAVDIPDLAQRNVATLFAETGRGVAMLAFYEHEGILTFTSGGELFLARRIDVTLTQLMEADDERRNQYFERIALELQRSLDNFDRVYQYVPISKLLLGPMPRDIGLQAYLASNVYVPVESIDLGTVMDFSAVPELKEAARQSQCLRYIGAALRDESASA